MYVNPVIAAQLFIQALVWLDPPMGVQPTPPYLLYRFMPVWGVAAAVLFLLFPSLKESVVALWQARRIASHRTTSTIDIG